MNGVKNTASKISESIFDNGTVVIPMAEVQHIERLTSNDKSSGILVITSHTRWNFERDMWDNPIYLSEKEVDSFIESWCYFRYEKDIKPTEQRLY